MATVTGLTADRMLEIEAASVVDGDVVADHLILTRHDASTIDAGNVRGSVGPIGPTGPTDPGPRTQPGVVNSGDAALTINSISQVTIAAGTIVITTAAGLLIKTPSTSAVLIAIPAAVNNRLDQIVVDSAGVVTRLAGTSDLAGNTLANRTGAAAIPAGSMLLHDILVTSGGVLAANVRDRRSWARGFYHWVQLAGQTRNAASPATQLIVGTRIRVECSGKPISFTLAGRADSASTWSAQRLFMDGVISSLPECDIASGAPSAGNGALFRGTLVPSAGSHLFEIQQSNGGGSLSCSYDVITWEIEEKVVQNANNGVL